MCIGNDDTGTSDLSEILQNGKGSAHPGREPAGTGVGTMAAKNPKLASGTWAETDHAGNQRIWERKDSAIERHHVCAEGISIYRSQRGTG